LNAARRRGASRQQSQDGERGCGWRRSHAAPCPPVVARFGRAPSPAALQRESDSFRASGPHVNDCRGSQTGRPARNREGSTAGTRRHFRQRVPRPRTPAPDPFDAGSRKAVAMSKVGVPTGSSLRRETTGREPDSSPERGFSNKSESSTTRAGPPAANHWESALGRLSRPGLNWLAGDGCSHG
jgi:hypothetical protein